MDLSLLLQTLRQEWQEKLAESQHSQHREIAFKTFEHMAHAAIGMRRTGKTTLLFQKMRELLAEGVKQAQLLYLNFEDDRLPPLTQELLREVVAQHYRLHPNLHDQTLYLFFDEIQNIPDWAPVIRRLLDSKSTRIFISGSSAKLLSKEIATSLRGRSIATEVWPYSWQEVLHQHPELSAQPPVNQRALDHHHQLFERYLLTGGFPEVQTLTESERRRVLQSYVDVVVYRDIIERYGITQIQLIQYLVKMMLSLNGCAYSANKLFNDLKSQGFKVGKDTVYQYLDHIEDSFLAFRVPLYSESLRKVQVNPKKVYAIDPGLVNAYTMGFTNNIGRLFESLFYIDLRRQGHTVFYYKTQDNREVDFLTRSAEGKLHLYQITWDQTDPKTLAREQLALETASKELGIPGTIVDPKWYLTHEHL